MNLLYYEEPMLPVLRSSAVKSCITEQTGKSRQVIGVNTFKILLMCFRIVKIFIACVKICCQKMLDGAREAYDAFLERYPYCYGYWKKYADMEKQSGDLERAEQV